MFKFCPNCTKETMPGWKCCPYCGFKFEEISMGGTNESLLALDDAVGNLMGFASEKQAEEKRRIEFEEAERKRKEEERAEAELRKAMRFFEYEENFDGTFTIKKVKDPELMVGSVAIPYGVTSICKRAFAECHKITNLSLPKGLMFIDEDAFYNCNGLTSITIPDSVKNIGSSAFAYCHRLTSVIIGNGVTTICSSAFKGCRGLTSITVPDSVKAIGSEAFEGCCGLTSITVPDSVKAIGSSAFSDTAYYNDYSNWENGVLYIGNHLIKVSTRISGSYEIKSGTRIIADEAFYHYDGLTSITSIAIPDSVTAIGSSAFRGCCGLTTINFNGTKKQWAAITKGHYWCTGSFTLKCTDSNLG